MYFITNLLYDSIKSDKHKLEKFKLSHSFILVLNIILYPFVGTYMLLFLYTYVVCTSYIYYDSVFLDIIISETMTT